MFKKPTPIDRDTLPYRLCAGVVVFNSAGKVFLGRRADMSAPGNEDHAWQMPQGGIDRGEEPIDAALRELYEETSIRSVSILTAVPDWVSYDLPDDLLGTALKGKYRGQRQKWFAVLFEGDDAEINVTAPGGGNHKAEFSEWRWFDLDKIADQVAPFKRAAYQQVISSLSAVPAQIATLDVVSDNEDGA